MPPITKIALIGFLFIAFSSFSQVTERNQASIDSINKVMQHVPKHDTMYIEALLTKGHMYFDAQLFDSCETLYNTSIRLLNGLTVKELTKRHIQLKAHCYHSWGILYSRYSSFDKASEYFEKSLGICEELMDIRGTVFGLQELMMLSGSYSKDSLAAVYLKKSRQIHHKIVDSLEKAMNWQTFGQYFKIGRRNVDSSIFWYLKALRTFENHGAERKVAQLCERLGSLFLSNDDSESASHYLYKALEIEEKAKNVNGIINTRLSLSNLYTLEKDELKALELLGPALELSRKFNFFNRQANILSQMGINSMHLNKLDNADSFYRASLALVEEYELGISKKSSLYGHLAVVDEKKGDLQGALENVLTALDLKPENGQSLIYQHLHVGHLYFKLNKLDLAKQYTLTSLDACRDMGTQFELKEVLIQLSEVYKGQEDYEKALFYFRRSTVIRDSLNDLEGHRALIKKEAEYQISKKEQELALERKSMALLKQEQKAQHYLIVGLSLLLVTALLGFFIFYQRKRLVALEAKNKIMRQLHEIDGLKSRLQDAILQGQQNGYKHAHINDYLDTALSQREMEVLDELVKGKSNKEISDSLCISINTVTTHLKKVYSKLEVGNRTQAVKKASELRT